jgi:hypothetical protein
MLVVQISTDKNVTPIFHLTSNIRVRSAPINQQILRVRDQPFHVPGFPLIHEGGFAQPSLPLGCLAGKKMTGIGFGTLDFSASGQFKSFGRSSFCF